MRGHGIRKRQRDVLLFIDLCHMEKKVDTMRGLFRIAVYKKIDGS